jgi:hypothetical protein
MSFGQGVLQGLDMYRDFSQQRRANERNDASIQIAREQQDIANYAQKQTQLKETAKDVVGAIDGHFGAQGFSDYRSKPWAKLIDEAPEIAAKLANTKPDFTNFRNEDGDNVTAEIVGFDKREVDGQNIYVPMVKRRDTGQVVPMTVGRSADANDPVVQLSEDDLKDNMDGLWRGAVKNGGYQNDMSHLVGREAVIGEGEEKLLRDRSVATSLSEGILQTVGSDSSITPQAKTEFANLVLGIEDPEELKKIAVAQGIDVDALVAEGQAAAVAEIGATAPEGSLEKLLFEQGVTREVWENSDPEKRKLIVERLNEEQDWSALKDKTVGRVMAQVEELVTFPFDQIANLGNSIAESKFGRRLGLSDLTDDPAPTRRNTAVADKEREINRQKGMRTAEEVSSSFTTPAPFELTIENLQKAILDGTNQPTAEQQTEMVSFLNSKGIKTMADFEKQVLENKIADNDARMVAFVASMSHDGTPQQKDQVAQGLMNLIERGSMDTTQYQQAQMDDAAAGRRTAQYIAETARERLAFEIDQYDIGAVPDGVKASLELFDEILVDVGMAERGEDGELIMTDDDFQGGEDNATLIGRKISRYMGTHPLKAQGPKSLEAYLSGMKPSVGLYIQALAEADVNDVFSKENLLDFFRPEPGGTINFDLNNVRVGSVKDGKPQTIVYVGPDGVESQSVPLRTIQKASPLLARIVVTAAEANAKATK